MYSPTRHAEDVVDFLGIGAQKCGTSWLHRQMSRHPQVTFPKGKEYHYWDTGEHPDADMWVSSLQPSRRTTPDGRRVVTGEITPAYAILPTERIRAIRERCPDIRIFISLRNPVERAWSAALMAVVRSEMTPIEASDQWFLDHFRSFASMARGDYASCLERWWSEFPRDQLLVIFSDDIAARPADVLQSLATHLGIDGADFASLPESTIRELVRTKIRPSVAASGTPALRPTLVGPLLEMYAEPIDRLQRLIDRDVSHWRLPPALPQSL
ncbi:MAG: sulfotransferase domain-containing protein [Phycisphaerales bacterium]|nr:sulfotransferase domain-containing protein [Phycisphaerales bacterium]